LNTPGALNVIHNLFKIEELDPSVEFAHGKVEVNKSTILASLNLLGLLTPELSGWDKSDVDLTGLADKLTALRETAMETKNFAPVDALKTALLDAGVEVRMSKTGVDLEAGPNLDTSKLEGLL
jgi:cysteinyl-tRNA synthetase